MQLAYLMIAAALCLLLSNPVQARETFPVPCENKEGLWGYCGGGGAPAIPYAYHMAGEFNAHGAAFAVADQGWICIDLQGRTLLTPFIFDNGPDYFSQGLARFVENGKMGFFDQSCSVVIPAAFTFATPFEQGRAAVCQDCVKVMYGEHWTMEGGRWSCIDTKGNVVRRLDTVRASPMDCLDP